MRMLDQSFVNVMQSIVCAYVQSQHALLTTIKLPSYIHIYQRTLISLQDTTRLFCYIFNYFGTPFADVFTQNIQ